ncbi:G-protein coupled receptor moody-like [Branchiostoma lanceolatum]|uniref:G-protein coupled receptor moody-like n=1 Tax=Branchiostoma lanceolatum TaxID=7740 RepID=UPI0034513D7B
MVIRAGLYSAAVVIGVIVVVTILGCLLTIVTILTRPNLRKLVNVPLVSLSCAGLLYAICGPALWIHHFLHPQWEPPVALCWFESYITTVLFGVLIGHMLCIALQRYFIVCTYSTRLKSTCVLITMLLLAWLLPFVFFLPLNVLEEIKVDPKIMRCGSAGTTSLWAKILPAIVSIIIPYVASLVCYALIQNHVRKSRNRVMANAENDANRLAVAFSGGERGDACGKGDDASPSTSTATAHSLISPRKASDGGVWMGDDRSSSGDEEQNTGDQNKPGKPKVIFLAPPAANHARTDKQQRASQGSSSQHNAAERQITKMMMTLFAVFTACCMPMTLMVMIHDKVPSEAFMVGSILMALNGALNPIVYGLMNKNIRQGYKHIWDRILNYIT